MNATATEVQTLITHLHKLAEDAARAMADTETDVRKAGVAMHELPIAVDQFEVALHALEDIAAL